jgi:hypothetical protein
MSAKSLLMAATPMLMFTHKRASMTYQQSYQDCMVSAGDHAISGVGDTVGGRLPRGGGEEGHRTKAAYTWSVLATIAKGGGGGGGTEQRRQGQ